MVVLAIGESSRRSSFSLYGYERRETNPVLRATGGLHLLEGVARRGSTLYALPEILARGDVKLPQVVSRLGVPTACYVNYTLYDNCAELHGMPPGIPLPPEQAEIPLIVKGSVLLRIVGRDEYRQQDVFDTVLDLQSIESPVADRSRSFVKREDAPAPTPNRG